MKRSTYSFFMFSSFLLFLVLGLGEGRADLTISGPIELSIKKDKLMDKLLGPGHQYQRSLNKTLVKSSRKTSMDTLDVVGVNITALIEGKIQDKFLLQNKIVSSVLLRNLKGKISKLNYLLDYETLLEGNLVKLKMDIECFDIEFSSKKNINALVTSNISLGEQGPSAKIEKVVLWQDVEFSEFDIASCRGAKGAEEELKKIVRNKISDSKSFVDLVKPLAQQELDELIQEKWTELKKPKSIYSFKDLKVNIELSRVSDCGKAFCLKGKSYAIIDATKTQYRSVSEIESPIAFTAKGGESSVGSLRLSQTWIQMIVAHGNDALFMKFQTDTKSHKPLRKLMDSRFQQGYVWRDLRNFAKGTNLYMSAEAPLAPHLEEALIDEDNKLLIPYHSVVRTSVLAPKDKEYQNYAYLTSSMKAEVAVDLQESEIIVTSKIAQMETQHIFDTQYATKYKPDSKVKESRINKALYSLFDGLELLRAPRNWELWDGFSVRLNSFVSTDQQSIVMDLK